ncbi:carboxymuconolactone decarboxylase family protein [Roseovarius salinarum]|uniref:hypothetical protein n=1 Tax=Roseovarius salinarum TaxID=1981892 RepID=UPI001E6123FF|nr:hypothetical protein [Roseovarius salinarum]
MHARATANTDASPKDVREASMPLTVNAGVPATNRAIQVAKAAYAEIGIAV